jgi:aminoglycoside N3'-acetyltransferase
MELKKENILAQISSLGISADDVFFISADLLKVGYFNRSKEQTYQDWVEIFVSLIGRRGTLVIPAYSPTFLRFRKRRDVVFNIKSEPSAGALSLAIHRYGKAARSLHPTNSCFAIGPMADYILRGHDHNASSYLPYQRVLELKGKNLMLGTVDKGNSPMAFHLIQEQLGHTRSHPSAGLHQTYFEDPLTGQVKLFTRRDVGGCTRGLYNLIGQHLIGQAMKVGTVGRGLSACVDIEKSASLIKQVLQLNPNLIRCDHKDCISCYGRFVYNGYSVFKFWPKKIVKSIFTLPHQLLKADSS